MYYWNFTSSTDVFYGKIFFSLKILFESYGAVEGREIFFFNMLVYCPSGCNSYGRARPKAGASFRSLMGGRGPSAWTIFSCFSQLAGSWIRSRAFWTLTCINMGCGHYKQWFLPLGLKCYSPIFSVLHVVFIIFLVSKLFVKNVMVWFCLMLLESNLLFGKNIASHMS